MLHHLLDSSSIALLIVFVECVEPQHNLVLGSIPDGNEKVLRSLLGNWSRFIYSTLLPITQVTVIVFSSCRVPSSSGPFKGVLTPVRWEMKRLAGLRLRVG